MKLFQQAMIITVGLAIGASAFAKADCMAHPKDQWISQQAFKTALEKRGFQVKTFKVSDNCYEMYGKSPKGKKVEMYFDTKTGEIVKKEIDD